MTKTKELEDLCIQGLIDADKLVVLDADSVMASTAEAQVTLGTILFPSHSADFGHVTHVAITNPERRWWTFWRPRTVVIDFHDPHSINER